MKILYLVPQYWPFQCGSGRYFQLPAEHFASRGHEVTVFTTDALEHDYFMDSSKRRATRLFEVHNGVSVRRFRARHIPWDLCHLMRNRIPFRWAKHLFSIPFVPGLFRESMRDHDYDIVHGGILPYGILLYAAWKIARSSNAPLILTPCLHIGEPEDNRVLEAHSDRHQIDLLRGADLVLAFTGREREKLSALGVPVAKIDILGDGVSPEAVGGGDGDSFRRRYGISNPIVLFLGTRAYDKGTVHLVKAAESLWDRGRDFTLVLAGSSSNRDFIDFYAGCSNTVRENTLLLTGIHDMEKRDLLAASEMLVMPSRNDSFGVVFLEAWVYRKPVIGAVAGGVPEVIDDGADGFLVPFGDVGGLAEKMALLLEDRGLAAAMGERGYAEALGRFAIGKKFEVLERAYEKLTEARK